MMSLQGQQPGTPRHLRLPDTFPSGTGAGQAVQVSNLPLNWIASTLAFVRTRNDISKPYETTLAKSIS